MEKQQPPFKTHRVEHRDFTSELRTLREDFQLGNKGVLVNLLLYLQQWIKNHAQGADHEHAKFLKARGERRELESKDGGFSSVEPSSVRTRDSPDIAMCDIEHREIDWASRSSSRGVRSSNHERS